MPDDLPVTVLPAMPVGKSRHLAFPTLRAETLTQLWTDLGESVAPWSGGQPQIMDIVARDLTSGHVRRDRQHLCLADPTGMFPDRSPMASMAGRSKPR